MKYFKLATFSAVALMGLAAAASAAGTHMDRETSLPVSVCQTRDLETLQFTGNECSDTRKLVDNVPLLKDNHVTFDGWLSGGEMHNADNPRSGFHGPVGYTDKDNFQLNQAYLSLARTAPMDNRGLFIGGRIDGMYGSDFFFTTAAGLDAEREGNTARWHDDRFTNGWALPQAYVTVNYNDLQVKAGHFYQIVTSESVMAKDNFFNTHTYAFSFGEPATNSGILVSKPLNGFTFTGGVVNGWNQYSANSDSHNFTNILGRAAYAGARFGLAFSVETGRDSDINVPGIGLYSNRTLFNAGATVNINDHLNYLVEGLHGEQAQSLGFNALDDKVAKWSGINQQLIYAFNSRWSVGGRFEWFDDPEGYLVTGQRIGNPGSRFRFPGNFYDASLGVNFKPHPNLTLRGEVREDWYTGRGGYSSPAVPVPGSQPYSDSRNANQFLFGLNAIAQF